MLQPRTWDAPRRGPGICSMRGSCGKTSIFGAELPCPDDDDATPPSSELLQLMRSVCGPAFAAPEAVCCTQDQLSTLGDKLQQAAPLIASCPACINNFRSFYCDFTCSPNQSTFISVLSTQETTDGRQAVKEVDYEVSDQFKQGFYDSCKDVQFGATNGFSMDLIGGGAKNASAFLKYMGDVRPGLGSPFQINFPDNDDSQYTRQPLKCSDPALAARCACADCPSICPTLPYVPPPTAGRCTVGAVSCLTFSLLIIYSVAILLGLVFFSWKQALRHRQRRYERVALLDPPLSPSTSGPNNGVEGLIGRGDDAESGPSGSIHFRLGRGASLLDPMEHLQPKQNKINATLRRFFYRLGLTCARRPMETFALAAVVIAALNIGWKYFQVETDPVRLWVAPSSESATEKHFFDETFGPFYRDEQIFITAKQGTPMTYDTLEWWLNVETEIMQLKSPSGHTLQDVCFAPAGKGTACVVQSISAWLGDDMEQWGDQWRDRISDCAARPGECLPPFGQPILPNLVLGGGDGDWLNSKAFIITYVVDNFNDDRVLPAEEWERTLRDYLAGLSKDGVTITYSTGISLEEELNKSTNTDMKIVVLSYLVMFLYVSLTLGGGIPPSLIASTCRSIWRAAHKFASTVHLVETPPPTPTLSATLTASAIPRLLSVNSKFSLGLFGICIVLIAVSSSVGLFSLLGVRVTLIIAEVIPFLVLAVGVDNVFILVHELDRQNALHAAEDESIDSDHQSQVQSHGASLSAEERVARAVARMGPSILLSSVTETVAFGLGALVGMPAVRNFAIYAAGSVVLGAVMQVTVFVSAMTLDLRRSEAMRMDCFPCIRLRPPIGLYDRSPVSSESPLARFFRKHYAPTLLRPEIKQAVVALFGALLLVSIIGMQHITLGLDQRLALPSSSHLVPYFNDLDAYFDFGPPVYFVARDVDPTTRTGQQKMCGRFTTCLELSMANILEAERKRPESSFLATPPSVWIDDFLQWTNPSFESCCRVKKTSPDLFCNSHDSARQCRPCFQDENWDSTMLGFPENEDFMKYLQQWLSSPTNEECPLGGQSAYSTSLKLSNSNDSILSSHFRTYHTPLKSQEDYINALEASRRISNEISHQTGIKVFPYSLFYVFFDQYSHIINTAIKLLSLALIAIFIITSILLGSWRTGGIVTFTCALATSTVVGIMGFWGISLNALSLVNLVISVGIAVEFSSHVARAFMGAGGGWEKDQRRERDERAIAALVDVGPSVFSGITLTKLIGISVLALTRSKLLETYYFRMWLSLIIAGATHGLILLPVLLSYLGGQGYSLEDTDEEWVTSQMRRPMDYEYAPFADTDSMISDR
ncbi:niemann-Pick C1 protein [Tremella mesenterica]|uniref:Niemann-Pick C1 protein n=1 Tax=Tremella mesenterica TaxID=5217 RepID=A0A4Q1BFC9_TREME|nr:uncharacterized protein TREMEDRAFT_60540 [Tremella mesenterica DSM 1558]EIW71618.1 hypothetical protein TREMEDRAFT_60540 [Tremella mesenterica DSM 1558]RXK34931.1 niemann-Pick C1 protein [Tremella mesenterica]